MPASDSQLLDAGQPAASLENGVPSELQQQGEEEEEVSAGGGGATDLLFLMEAAWAIGPSFIGDLVVLSLLGCIMGALSYGYMYLVGNVTEQWLSAVSDYEYPSDFESIKLMNGSALWIPICWGGGTIVGILKVIVGIDEYPSFLEDLRHREVCPISASKVLVCCIASLLAGAAMGPEAGLGAAGGAVGTLLSRVLCGGELCNGQAEMGEARRKERLHMYTLAGMSAAFGSILPAPWVALLLVLELSFQPFDEAGRQKVMLGNQSICLLGLSASLAWVVKYALDKSSGDAETPPLPGAMLDFEYSNELAGKAILLGFASVIVLLVYFIVAGVTKRIFLRLTRLLQRRCGKRIRIILMASLAGLLTGCLGYLVPLSLTDGATQIMPTLKACKTQHFSTSDLIAIAFAKSAAYWVAAGGGLVGGIFFPLLYIGIIAGELLAKFELFAPGARLTVPVMMASVPSSIMPAFFTMIALPLSTFNLGPKWCVPIFIASLTSYTVLVGTGLLRRLLLKAASA